MTIHDFLSNKNILIFGLGRQGGGLGDANYLANHDCIVRVTDQLTLSELGLDESELSHRIESFRGTQTEEDIVWADLIIQNPGVPNDHPLIIKAKELGKTVVSSIALFVKYAPIPTIGITGTRGKTTTTMLIAHILETAYPGRIVVGGNIPATSGLSLFDRTLDCQYAVLELSSFQLHSFHSLSVSPTYAVVTNLYPDHLNRYRDMAEYAQDKSAITAYLKGPGFVVYNEDNEGSCEIASHARVTKIGYHSRDASTYPSPIKGDHNQSNIAAAVTLARSLGISDNIIHQSVSTFVGVPYRQQHIAVINGVTFINDTTATTPTAAIAALRTMTTPTIWICGGHTKNLPVDDLLSEITTNQHLKKIILLGSQSIPEFTTPLRAKHGHQIAGQVDSMAEAVRMAVELATNGDTVLLSPGFSSFDLFKNEFDRGDQFNASVRSLVSKSL